jgi:putative transposase
VPVDFRQHAAQSAGRRPFIRSQRLYGAGIFFALLPGMPRKQLPRQSDYPYSLTARSNNREWFDLPIEQCWNIFVECISLTMETYGIETHCFILMSNHFHWLVSTPNKNLGDAMRFFMTESSRRIARATGRINKIYGTRYKWSVVGSPHYFANSVRYYYQNPVRAKICQRVEDYPWSSLRPDSGLRLTAPPLAGFEMQIPVDAKARLEWLNTLPDPEYSEIMRRALRRTEFRYPSHPSTKREISPNAFT